MIKAKYYLGDSIVTKPSAICGADKKGIIYCEHSELKNVFGIKLDDTKNKFHQLQEFKESRTKIPQRNGLWINKKDFTITTKEKEDARAFNEFLIKGYFYQLEEIPRYIRCNRSSIEDEESGIEEYISYIEDKKASIRRYICNIKKLQNTVIEQPKLNVQYEKIMKHKLIEKVFKERNYIVIKTKNLTYHHIDEYVPDFILGAYYIFIPITPDDYSSVKVINYKKQVRKIYYGHPCIKTQGQICLGDTVNAEIKKYKRENNYSMIVFLLINFLQQPNYDTPYIAAEDFRAAQPVTYKPEDVTDYLSKTDCDDNENWDEDKYTKKLIALYKKDLKIINEKEEFNNEDKVMISSILKRIDIVKQRL